MQRPTHIPSNKLQASRNVVFSRVVSTRGISTIAPKRERVLGTVMTLVLLSRPLDSRLSRAFMKSCWKGSGCLRRHAVLG